MPAEEEIWPEEVWEALPSGVQRETLHHLARLLIRWWDTLERRP